MTGAVRLSCVIPAFNEAPRIGAVLAVALATPEIDEVIVVDDGSTDATAEIVEARARYSPKLRLLRQPGNGGKTRAVAAGLATVRGPYVMLLDSDLLGLRPEHLSRLAAPVLHGAAGAAISLRGNAPAGWRLIGLDYISGERVMARRILADRLDALDRLPRFGLEVFMNRVWLAQGLRIAVVPWPEVASPMKARKRGGILAGIAADVAMLRDMFATVSPVAAIGQILAMRARRL